MGTIGEYITYHQITLKSTPTLGPNHPDGWGAGATHWSCKVSCHGRTATFDYHMGAAYKGQPVLADLLDCLKLDASSAETETFPDWAADMGLSDDSISALQAFGECR